MTASANGVLAKAFMHDPMFAYVLPDATIRERRLRVLFSAAVQLGHRYGGVATAGNGSGVAVWTDHQHVDVSFTDAVRNRMLTPL